MAFGQWKGIESGLPGGVAIANSFAQYANQMENLAINKIKHQQILKQEEEANKLISKDFLFTGFNIGEQTPKRKEVAEQLWKQIDPDGTGFATRRDVDAMNSMIKGNPMIQKSLMQAEVEDAKSIFETANKAYSDYREKATLEGKDLSKDEKYKKLEADRERTHQLYSAVQFKSMGVEKAAHDYSVDQRMHERELERRITEHQKAADKLADTTKRMETYLEKQRLANEGKIAAKGAGGGKGGSKPPAPTADMKEFDSARRAYTDNGIALPPHLQSIDVYKAWKKALPGPPKQGTGGGGLSGLMNNQTAPKTNYKDMGNGVLQYIRE